MLKGLNFINILSERAFTAEANAPSFFDTISMIISKFVIDLWDHLLTLVIKIVYTVLKWAMTVIDFIYTFVRQLVGISIDSSGTSFLLEDDIIFKFLSGEFFLPLMKYMLGFCFLLLIVFTIIAIVKNEYDYTVYGRSNDKKQVLVKSLQAVFLMILVPFIVVGSIIGSNALLRALTEATSVGGSGTSIGSQIYVASSYKANAYRHYAESNYKIPITYNFSEVEDKTIIAGWEADGGVEEINKVVNQYLSMPVWSRGLKAFEMHISNNYFALDYIDEITYQAYQAADASSSDIDGLMTIYEGLYDKGINTYTPEYYVMADTIEYFFGSNRTIRFVTMEQVYKTCSMAGIESGIDYDGKYYTAQVEYNYDIGGRGNTITYRHRAGATDEADGAVFVCATQEQTESGVIYYKPYIASSSSYYNGGNITVARGTFNEDGYPTAIRIRNNIVECYRENLNVPTLIDFFPTISYEKPEGTTQEIGNWITRTLFEGVTGVNPDELVPYIYFNFDLFSLFTKSTNVVTKFADGGLDIDYYFSDSDIEIENLYWIPEISLFILIFAIGTVFSIILKITFGLVGRIFDIIVLIISYPATLALFPLKGNNALKKWSTNFFSKLIEAYGVIIALNLMFLFATVLSDFKLLQPGDNANIIQQLGLFFSNHIIRILFLLVAFSLMAKIPLSINKILNGKEDKEDKEDENAIISRGEKSIQDLKNPFTWMSDLVTGKMFIDQAKKAKEFSTKSIPGGAFVATKHRKKKEEKEENEEFAKALISSPKNKSNTNNGSSSQSSGNSNMPPEIHSSTDANESATTSGDLDVSDVVSQINNNADNNEMDLEIESGKDEQNTNNEPSESDNVAKAETKRDVFILFDNRENENIEETTKHKNNTIENSDAEKSDSKKADRIEEKPLNKDKTESKENDTDKPSDKSAAENSNSKTNQDTSSTKNAADKAESFADKLEQTGEKVLEKFTNSKLGQNLLNSKLGKSIRAKFEENNVEDEEFVTKAGMQDEEEIFGEEEEGNKHLVQLQEDLENTKTAQIIETAGEKFESGDIKGGIATMVGSLGALVSETPTVLKSGFKAVKGIVNDKLKEMKNGKSEQASEKAEMQDKGTKYYELLNNKFSSEKQRLSLIHEGQIKPMFIEENYFNLIKELNNTEQALKPFKNSYFMDKDVNTIKNKNFNETINAIEADVNESYKKLTDKSPEMDQNYDKLTSSLSRLKELYRINPYYIDES